MNPSWAIVWLEVASGAAAATAAIYGLCYFIFWPRFKESVAAIVDDKLEDVVARLNHVDGMREHIGRFGDAVGRFEANVLRLQGELDRQGRAIARLEGRLWPNRLPEDTGV